MEIPVVNGLSLRKELRHGQGHRLPLIGRERLQIAPAELTVAFRGRYISQAPPGPRTPKTQPQGLTAIWDYTCRPAFGKG